MPMLRVWLSDATYAALEAAAQQQALAPNQLAANILVARLRVGTYHLTVPAVPDAVADAAAQQAMDAFLAPFVLATPLKRRIVGFTRADGLTVERLRRALEANDPDDRFVQTVYAFGPGRFAALRTAWLATPQEQVIGEV